MQHRSLNTSSFVEALSSALLIGLATVPVSAHALDCRVREPAHGDPTWTCKSAALLMSENQQSNGGDPAFRCVPASEFSAWGCLALDTNTRLCSDGVAFNMSVYLTHNDVSIDCAGQVVAPRGASTGNSARSGLRTPYTRSIQNVAIQNCQIVDSPGYGIDLKRYFRGDESCLTATGPYDIAPSSGSGCVNAMEGHRNIRISNVGISSASQIGIYVGQASRDVTISDVDIDDAHIGVYIEASTTGTRVSRAVITNSHEREGIAVDSSRYNIIEDSLFEHNGADLFTGINLYKNAGEYEGQVCPVIRPFGADHNIIRRNHFFKDDVNVASRESRDSYLNCAKYHYCSINYRDRANENVLLDNVFHDGAQLDMLDDTYVVHGNRFESGAELELGAKQHEYALHGTVAQNVLEAGATVRLNASNWSALDVRNNVNAAGACVAFGSGGLNQCGRERTLVFGEKVLSAGLLAVLF
jgi:hypothetical protein